jgi:hypothetical protein
MSDSSGYLELMRNIYGITPESFDKDGKLLPGTKFPGLSELLQLLITEKQNGLDQG